MRALARQLLKLGIAWLLIVLGVIFLFSPIPIGIFFIAVGLSLLISTSEAVTHKVRDFRGRHEKFNLKLLWVEKKLNNRLKIVSDAMHKTRPPDENTKE